MTPSGLGLLMLFSSNVAWRRWRRQNSDCAAKSTGAQCICPLIRNRLLAAIPSHQFTLQQQSNMQCTSLSTAFLQAKSLVAVLQSEAVDLQQCSTAHPAALRRKQLCSTVRVLQELHSLITNTLIELELSGRGREQQDSSRTLIFTCASACSVCGCWHGCTALSDQQLQEAAAQLEQGLSEWMCSALFVLVVEH
jgi:hypothetical protein